MSTDTTDTTDTITEVTTAPNEPITVRRDASVMEMAEAISGSREFGLTPQKAAVRIWAAQELGVGAIAACAKNGIRIENGTISASAAIIESVVERSPVYDWELLERNANHCAIAFYRKGQLRGTIDYTIENARTAGLLSKLGDNWKKHPEAMLFAAAFRTGARAFCAGAFNGVPVYGYEELGIRVDEDGLPVESEADSGSELCTRDQRQTLCRLVEAAGESMQEFMAKAGIRLLDELSQYEAAKEIKRLEKRLLKARKPSSPTESNAVQTGDGGASPSAAPAPQSLTPAQQTLSDAFDESRKPSTQEQREAIIGLAQFLEPDETACCEMITEWLIKRNCKKMVDLDHLQAAGLIEAIQAKIKEQKNSPPFNPTPEKSGTAKKKN